MAKETIIPAGFRLTIKSWENDGDANREIIKEGLTRDEVKFYVGFAKFFYSRNNWRGPKGFGNMYEPRAEEKREAMTVIAAYLVENKAHLAKDWDLNDEDWDNIDGMSDIVHELHYELFGGSEYFFRVLDSYKVEQIPEDIRMLDVTSDF